MRVLIVADIHANLEAFRSVLDDAKCRGGFDEIWSLGDLVGYGPNPGECIDLLREYTHHGVAGNHDLAATGRLSVEAFNPHAAEAAAWTTAQLTREQAAYIGDLPLRVEVEDFTLVHGSPRDPVWEYVISIQAAVASFDHFDTTRCLVGHSHIPFICRPAESGAMFQEFPLDAAVSMDGERVIINPGGVGQPRDGDSRASYAVYDSDRSEIFHHRVEYDIQSTQEKMTACGLSSYLVDRLPHGR